MLNNDKSLPRKARTPQRKAEFFCGPEDTVECLICGKNYQCLGRHLVAIHGISGKEYIKKFKLKPKCLVSNRLKNNLSDLFLIKFNNEIRAKSISKIGNSARKKYWDKPDNRLKKSEFMKEEGVRRMNDPLFRNKMETAWDKFRVMGKKRTDKASKLRSVCLWCKKTYGPKDVYKKRILGPKLFLSRNYCSPGCGFKARKGKSQKEYRLYIKKLNGSDVRFRRYSNLNPKLKHLDGTAKSQ